MIKLRLVGPSADLQHLVYSNKKTGRKGSHLVEVDDRLLDTLEDLFRRRKRGERDAEREPVRAPVPRVESKLPPRDVQRLLRAGRTVEQVAKTAQVPVAWVEQFLGPVLYERTGMVREAQRARLEKQRLGVSGAPLGDAVSANLRSRHVRLTDREFADAWDAHRTEGQPWTITLRFRFRGREQRAVWKYDPAHRAVTPGNRLAADLGWVAPGRRLAPARPAPAKTQASKAKPAKRAAAKKRAPARKRTVARKRAPAKRRAPARKRAPAKKRATARKRAPAKKRATARKPGAARKRTVARRPAKRRAPARRTRRR